jgi:hypothetical protein
VRLWVQLYVREHRGLEHCAVGHGAFHERIDPVVQSVAGVAPSPRDVIDDLDASRADAVRFHVWLVSVGDRFPQWMAWASAAREAMDD